MVANDEERERVTLKKKNYDRNYHNSVVEVEKAQTKETKHIQHVDKNLDW